jgi:hypothetical protein
MAEPVPRTGAHGLHGGAPALVHDLDPTRPEVKVRD